MNISFLLLFLFPSFLTSSQIDIDTSRTEKLQTNSQYYTLPYSNSSVPALYIAIKTIPITNSNRAAIYVSQYESKPSTLTNTFSSELNAKNLLYLPISHLVDRDINIGIKCQSN